MTNVSLDISVVKRHLKIHNSQVPILGAVNTTYFKAKRKQ